MVGRSLKLKSAEVADSEHMAKEYGRKIAEKIAH